MSAASERLGDLASRLMDGSLSPSEESELGEALRTSREAREIMRSYFRLEGAVSDLARVELVSRSGPSETVGFRAGARAKAAPAPAPPPRRAAWAVGALAAAALAALLYAALREDQTPRGPANGSTARNSRPVPSSAPPVLPGPEPAAPAPESRETPAPPRPERRESSPEPQAPEPPPVAPSPRVPAPEPSAPRGSQEAREEAAPAETVVTQVTIERAEGDVTLHGSGRSRPARAGDPVPAGHGLETGGGKSLAVLTFPDGSRLEARSDTSIRDVRPAAPQDARGGRSVFLHHGSLWAHVRPQPGDRPFVVGTPRGEARVLGTILTMHVDADPKGAVRLDVEEGKVRFSRPDGRSLEVPAGHSVTSAAGSEFALLRSTEMLVSFQDGAAPTADYAGTRDTSISEKNPGANYGHAKTITVEGEDGRSRHQAQWALLRWDLSSIPPGSRVRAASLSLHVTEPSRGAAFYFHEPARAWTESEATWKFAASGSPWRLPGSLGGVERWAPPLGTLAALVKGEYTATLNEAGVALVQSWVNAPSSNVGLILAGTDPGASLHFQSREASIPETRPKLTVVIVPRR
jgi:ferric-dicitrate binding protein FerR (iron transport regulator)